MQLLAFDNIKEIKFTKVGDNLFSLSIKSDINNQGKNTENCEFNASLVQLDSALELTVKNNYTTVGDGIISEYYSIPINVKLLLNQELNELFNIEKL